jgi:hypothetical protein
MSLSGKTSRPLVRPLSGTEIAEAIQDSVALPSHDESLLSEACPQEFEIGGVTDPKHSGFRLGEIPGVAEALQNALPTK